MKLFTKDINQKLFAQYRIGSNLNNQKVVAKIFNPYGEGRWYLLNSDPNDPDYLWAIVKMGDNVEIGSVSRSELERIRIKPFGLPLERDMYFNDRNAMEVLEGLEKGQTFAAGGMTVGRWYKDKSGKEFRYIGESQGKLLFNDGEKIIEKDEEDFEDAPKEKKFFGFFEEGGEINFGEDLGDGFFIGNDVYITDSSSMYKGKTGFISGLAGKDLLVTILENGNERNILVRKKGAEIIDAPMADGGKLPETIGGYKIDFSKWREDVIATIEVEPNSAPFEPFYLKGVGKTEKQAFQNLEKEYNSMKKSSYVVTFSIDDSEWIKSKPISAYTEEQASNILYESASMEGDVSILKIDKISMAEGGDVDTYEVELSAVPNPDYADKDDRGSINIKKSRKKVSDVEEARRLVREFIEENDLGGGNWPNGGVYKNGKKIGYISYNGRFWDDTKMAMGGKVKFEDKVKAIKASLLKRKKVSPKVQKDYGKTYSPKEAEESAKRIAGALRAKYDLKKKFKKGGKTIAQTPAPKKDRVFGSSTNKAGSASSKKTASNIELNESIVKTLSEKAKEYNEKHSSKVSTSTLKAVMRRGMGAFSTSHRPGMTRQGWGYARVNKFLKKKGGAQVKAAYVQDDDLL